MASEDFLRQEISDRDKEIRKLKRQLFSIKKEVKQLSSDVVDMYQSNYHARCRKCEHLYVKGYICSCGCDNSVKVTKYERIKK